MKKDIWTQVELKTGKGVTKALISLTLTFLIYNNYLQTIAFLQDSRVAIGMFAFLLLFIIIRILLNKIS